MPGSPILASCRTDDAPGATQPTRASGFTPIAKGVDHATAVRRQRGVNHALRIVLGSCTCGLRAITDSSTMSFMPVGPSPRRPSPMPKGLSARSRTGDGLAA